MSKKASAKPAKSKPAAVASKGADKAAAVAAEVGRVVGLLADKLREKTATMRALGPAKQMVKELNAKIARLDNEMESLSDDFQRAEKGQLSLFTSDAPAMEAAASHQSSNGMQTFDDAGLITMVSPAGAKFVIDGWNVKVDDNGVDIVYEGRSPKKFGSVDEARIGAIEMALTKMHKDAGKPAVDHAAKRLQVARHGIPGAPEGEFEP